MEGVATEMVARGICVYVAVPDNAELRGTRDRLSDVGCVVVPIPYSKSATGALTNHWSERVRRALRRRSIRDITPPNTPWFVHVGDPAGAFVHLASLPNTPVAIVSHVGVAPGASRSLATSLRRHFVWAGARAFCPVSDDVDANWGHPRRAAMAVRCAPGGVTLPPFRPWSPPTNKPWRLITVGRLIAAVKGHDVLLRALSLLPAEKATLTIVGEGPDRSSLEALARSLGVAERVTFAGWRHAIDEELAAADLFVFPSRIEPWGLALLEAMAVGMPCVASRLPGICQMVGDAIPLVVPGDAKALASAMSELFDDDSRARACAVAARERASGWTWSRTTDQLLSAIEKP